MALFIPPVQTVSLSPALRKSFNNPFFIPCAATPFEPSTAYTASGVYAASATLTSSGGVLADNCGNWSSLPTINGINTFFHLNYGATIKIEMNGLVPHSCRLDCRWFPGLRFTLPASNIGSFTGAFNIFSSASTIAYCCGYSTSSALLIWASLHEPAFIPACTSCTCDDVVPCGEGEEPRTGPCNPINLSGSWTYTCDVPCGRVVEVTNGAAPGSCCAAEVDVDIKVTIDSAICG